MHPMSLSLMTFIYINSEKLLLYKNNDALRIKVAKKGQKKYFKYFNSKIISKYLIEKTFDTKSKQKYLWDK